MKLVCVQCSVVWCRSQERVLMVGAIETRLSDPRLMLVFSTVLDLACLSWCRITTSKIFPEQIDNIFLVNIFGIEIPQPRSRLRTESCIYAIHRQQQTSSSIHWYPLKIVVKKFPMALTMCACVCQWNDCWPELWADHRDLTTRLWSLLYSINSA